MTTCCCNVKSITETDYPISTALISNKVKSVDNVAIVHLPVENTERGRPKVPMTRRTGENKTNVVAMQNDTLQTRAIIAHPDECSPTDARPPPHHNIRPSAAHFNSAPHSPCPSRNDVSISKLSTLTFNLRTNCRALSRALR